MSAADDADDGDRFRDPVDVAENLQTYLDVLYAEREVIEDTIDGLDDGSVAVEEMVEVLPEPMPMEAWERDEFQANQPYQLNPEDDAGE